MPRRLARWPLPTKVRKPFSTETWIDNRSTSTQCCLSKLKMLLGRLILRQQCCLSKLKVLAGRFHSAVYPNWRCVGRKRKGKNLKVLRGFAQGNCMLIWRSFSVVRSLVFIVPHSLKPIPIWIGSPCPISILTRTNLLPLGFWIFLLFGTPFLAGRDSWLY